MHQVIVGSSLSALVAATELARSGQQVTLIKHGGSWGGHFAGLDKNGLHFDAGMNIVELTSSNASNDADLSSYNLNTRNDVGRFFPRIKAFIEDLQPIRVIRQPESLYQGKLVKDFLLCNNFEILTLLSPSERSRAVLELERQKQHELATCIE